jgi:putative membrane protein
MRHFVFRWIVTTVAVFVAAPVVGINYGGHLDCLLGASLLLGIINAFIRPILLVSGAHFSARSSFQSSAGY